MTENKTQCDFCLKSYSSIYYLRKHIIKCEHRNQDNRNEFKCDFCDKLYNSNYYLQVHLQMCKNKCVSNLETKLKEKDELIKFE